MSTARLGAGETQRIREPPRGDAVGRARRCVGVQGGGVAEELGVVVARDPDEHAGVAAGQAVQGQAGPLEGLAGGLEEQALLGVHRRGLARSDAEVAGVELVDVGTTGAVSVLNLSASGDLTEAAANLFGHLRRLDASKPSAIAVMPVPATGLGEAINDRLIRAAAPRGGTGPSESLTFDPRCRSVGTRARTRRQGVATLFVHHPCYVDHLTPVGHPERPDRMRAIDAAMEDDRFQALERLLAPEGSTDQILLAHPQPYVSRVHSAIPTEGLVQLDADTTASPGSWQAAIHAVGGACLAVDRVMEGTAENAFSAHRPPGHHAETDKAMGFCLFNNVAIAARHAQRAHGAERVGIVDFDVHHGNGTQDIFWQDDSVFFASTHQMPLYPGSGAPSETGVGNIINAPLSPGDGGEAFREAMTSRVLPQLAEFNPDLIIISAGFDAHQRDPLASINLVEDDYHWVTGKLMDIADQCCEGRVVSMLEGGYDLVGLARSVATHIDTLMRG